MRIHSALLGVCKTQCTAEGSSDWMMFEYTYDEYCIMLLVLSTCNRWAGTAAWEYVLYYPGWHYRGPNAFQWLRHHPYEAGSVTPMAHLNAGCPKTTWILVNEDAAMEKLMILHETWDYPKWGHLKYAMINSCIHTKHMSASTDEILRMAMTWTCCEWAALHNILWTDEVCYPCHLWAQDNPHSIREHGYQVLFSISIWSWARIFLSLIFKSVFSQKIWNGNITVTLLKDSLKLLFRLCLNGFEEANSMVQICLENVIVIQLVKKFPTVMDIESWLPSSQDEVLR